MQKKRQGWERLCGAAKAAFFVPAAGARSARDHGAGFTKTGLSRAAFERTARRLPRERRRVQKRSAVLKQPPVREREQPGARKNSH